MSGKRAHMLLLEEVATHDCHKQAVMSVTRCKGLFTITKANMHAIIDEISREQPQVADRGNKMNDILEENVREVQNEISSQIKQEQAEQGRTVYL
jgi:hypothetical protein